MKNNSKSLCQDNTEIPKKGVMFLGGHPNLVKKLQQVYPKWDFISDKQLRHKASFKQDIIFYWTGHGSHQLMECIFTRASDKAKVMYVTATNLSLLLNEMNSAYSAVAAS